MTRLANLRIGQFTIRNRPPVQQRLLLALGIAGIVLVLYLVYEWGRSDAGFNKLAEMRRRGELAAQIDKLTEANEKLRSDIAAAELARKVDRQSYAAVEKSLADLQGQVLKHREELTFYRGIVSPEDGIGGLRVQRFQIFPAAATHHYRLVLVLLQSMRQDTAASGLVDIRVEGMRDGKTVELPLSQLGDISRSDGRVAFQFRYFQELEQDITLPPDFEPRAITVEVRSGRLAPLRETYPWQLQAEN